MFNRGSKSPPKDYNGERTSAAISEWAGREMRNVVSRLGDYGALQSWLNKDTHSPHILVYTAKSSTPTLLKALGLKFPGAKFGVMKSTSRNAEVKDALGLGENDIPALFVITDGSIENAERYQGKLKYKPLNQYLQQTLPSQSKTPLSNDSKKPRTEFHSPTKTMRKLSLMRGIREEDYVKLISVDGYEYSIETATLRRHSTIMSTLFTGYGGCTGKKDNQDKQEVQFIPTHTTNSSITTPTRSAFEHDDMEERGTLDTQPIIETPSAHTLSRVASKIRNKCTPLSHQRSSFSGGNNSNGSGDSHKAYTQAQSSMSTGGIGLMNRSTSSLPSPPPPTWQKLRGDSPKQSQSQSQSCSRSLPRPQSHVSLYSGHSSYSHYSGMKNLAAGSHEIVNTPSIHNSAQSDHSKHSTHPALPGLAEAIEPHCQNTQGALRAVPAVRSRCGAWSDVYRCKDEDGDASGNGNGIRHRNRNDDNHCNRNPLAVEPLSSTQDTKCTPHIPRTPQTPQTPDTPDTRIRYSHAKKKVWVSEEAQTVEAWVKAMRSGSASVDANTLSLTKLLTCLRKYDDMATLTLIEEHLADRTTATNSLNHLLLSKRHNLHTLHSASVVKVPAHFLPLLSSEEIDEIGGNDMKIILNSTNTLNLLQLLESNRLLVSPSMASKLSESPCLSFKLRIHNEDYLTIDM
ncbi:hypothetical protein E3P84_03194 [Wallemia ichthyophaga]|nr:hypothetical protein E3P84_03194 [Wallemia ichthyophaga]TIB40054.1 hypothetical protein E3P83_03152 [Wallemia ichthyophaga]